MQELGDELRAMFAATKQQVRGTSSTKMFPGTPDTWLCCQLAVLPGTMSMDHKMGVTESNQRPRLSLFFMLVPQGWPVMCLLLL
jgi:hypothetical protein